MERTKSSKSINLPDAINQSITKEFTQVPNELLRNPNLSFKAKGILCLLLSNKEGWYSYIKTIEQMTREKEDAVRSGIEELENEGYLLRVLIRDKKTKIRRGSFWAYSDVPGNFNMESTLEMLDNKGLEAFILNKGKPENPDLENPDLENPEMENPGLKILNIKRTNNKDINTSSEREEDDGKIKPSHFEDFWKLYPRKHSKGAAKTAWDKICRKKSKDKPTWDQIKQALQAQKKSDQWQDKKFIPLPTTWLNQSRWLDDSENLKSFGDQQSNKSELKQTRSPKKIIKQSIKSPDRFIEQCYEPAKQILSNKSNGQLPQLAQSLTQLYWYIREEQDKHCDHFSQQEQANIFLPPDRLIQYYIDWLEEQHWIDDREPRLFTPDHKIFEKFLNKQRERQNDRHPLTGR